MSENTLKLIADNEARWVDLRFTDPRGKEQHVTFPASKVDSEFFAEGAMFDGSSIAGWKGINESDMILMPDDATAVVDPFTEEVTVNLRCNIVEPSTMQGYERDPRSVALRAEDYLKSTGIGDTSFFGPEPEFFVFDNVQWKADMSGAMYKIDAEEAAWASSSEFEGGNMAHRPGVKAVISLFHQSTLQWIWNCDVRNPWSNGSRGRGPPPRGRDRLSERDWSEVQHSRQKADEVQVLKYVVHNVAHAYGKTATFMPKPLVGDNGSGMHCHQSIWKNGENLFAGNGYAGLSDEALYYIGGIIKHARAINAFANASTNSYKRLVPGFEAPVMLAYSARNRSASIRIPYVSSAKGRRIEVRFPDPTANPYLAFSAMLMSGLDGIQNKIHPGEAASKDLYDLPEEEALAIPTVASSLEQALDALDADRAFLTAGGVFTDDMIDGYIELKREEVERLNMTTHPVEFGMYYSV